MTQVAAGTGANAGAALGGRPADARFANVLTSPQPQSCVDAAAAALNATAPGAGANANVREFADWQGVDVRR